MSNRPFENVHHMNMYMIEQWNNVVKPSDEVYYLGDFMYKMNPNTFVTNVLNKLNGKIYLIKGNHDKRYLNKYLERVEWIKDVEYLKYEHTDSKKYKFVLFHYPIFCWDGIWGGSIHLHGHTHKNTYDIYFKSPISERLLNVNCEFFDYKPISIEQVIDIMKDKKFGKI
ncbi:MAG: metallophosphoesterase [bacterium]